jgi:hypothetical protein
VVDFYLKGVLNMKENIFYIIVNNNFPTRVSYKHETFESADTEVKRLARNNPEEKFVIMKSVVAYQKNEFIKSNFVEPCDNEDDPNFIPF